MTFLQSTWSLADLFPAMDSPELQTAFKHLEAQIAEFEESRSDLVPNISATKFMSILAESEQFTRAAYRIYGFGSLLFAGDTQNQNTMAFIGRVQQFMAEMQNRTLFFSLWWKNLDETNAARLVETSGDYRYYLEAMRLFKAHTLSETEEKIVNLKNVTGIEALTTFYDAMTNRFTYKLELQGTVRELTRGELMSYVRQSDPDLRARAYQELFRVFAQEGPLLGQLYQTRARDWHIENVTMRNHASPLAARNLFNDIPDDVVDTLLEVSRKNVGIFQRFFKIKARVLRTAANINNLAKNWTNPSQ